MNIYLKVPNTSTLYICRRTTTTMTARWNSAAVVTDSPDAPDPRSSIISPPGLGTDRSALTGKLRLTALLSSAKHHDCFTRLEVVYLLHPPVCAFHHPSVSGTACALRQESRVLPEFLVICINENHRTFKRAQTSWKENSNLTKALVDFVKNISTVYVVKIC